MSSNRMSTTWNSNLNKLEKAKESNTKTKTLDSSQVYNNSKKTRRNRKTRGTMMTEDKEEVVTLEGMEGDH